MTYEGDSNGYTHVSKDVRHNATMSDTKFCMHVIEIPMSYTTEVTTSDLAAAVLNLGQYMQSLVLDLFLYVGRHCKHGYNRLNRLPMSYASDVQTTFGVAAAILNFDHVLRELGIGRCSIVSDVPENMDIAVVITLLCYIRPKFQLLQVWRSIS
jgi:hypothetical protein